MDAGGRGQAGRKRGRGGGGRHQGNKKKYSNHAGSKPQRGVPTGTRGILISCWSSKEVLAAKEAISVFGEVLERISPEKAKGTAAAAAPAEEGAEGGGGGDDIQAALAAEVAQLKDTGGRPFYHHTVGVASVVYLECKWEGAPSPSDLVIAACQEAADTHQNRTRLCNRFYPIEHTCYASMEKIDELAKRVVAEHFPEGAEEGIQFAVQYDHRAAPALDRMAVIDAFAQRIKAPHKVNLNAPQKTIIVNVLRTTCGVSVVGQYRELCKFNLRMAAMTPEEREAERQANISTDKQRQQQKQQDAGAGGGGEAPQPAAADAQEQAAGDEAEADAAAAAEEAGEPEQADEAGEEAPAPVAAEAATEPAPAE